jgi:3-oxoacyl-ACP reductase-like protein
MSALTYKQAVAHQHIQDTAAATWVIVHNLGIYPAIDVFVDYDGETQKIIPDSVEYTDSNTCTVTFSSAYTGIAMVA